jgi:adenylate cyclase class IV
MAVHRATNREIEVKLRVPDVQRVLQNLKNLGARYESRVLERNTLYDSPDSHLRRHLRLLRIRVEYKAQKPDAPQPRRVNLRRSARTILTSKAPAAARNASDRRYKEKLERELVSADSPAHWDRTLRSLGLRAGFRYDKFRSTFRLRRFPGLAIELDETPAGTFLELEGLPSAIDRAARALGYHSRDYYRGSYWDVYVADCRRRGRTPRHMVFNSSTFQ